MLLISQRKGLSNRISSLVAFSRNRLEGIKGEDYNVDRQKVRGMINFIWLKRNGYEIPQKNNYRQRKLLDKPNYPRTVLKFSQFYIKL